MGRSFKMVLRAWEWGDSHDVESPAAVGEQRIRTLGEAPKEIVDADGVYLVKCN